MPIDHIHLYKQLCGGHGTQPNPSITKELNEANEDDHPIALSFDGATEQQNGESELTVILQLTALSDRINSLSMTRIPSIPTKHLEHMLETSSVLTTLCIEECNIGDAGIASIMAGLTLYPRRTQKLKLSSVGLTKSSTLLRILRVCYDVDVKDLLLPSNEIGESHLKFVADAKQAVCFDFLDLSNNHLGSSGCAVLAKLANRANFVVEEIALESNEITGEAFDDLIKALASRGHCTTILASNNPLKEQGLLGIAEQLSSNECNFGHVELMNIEITDNGARAISNALRTNETLECLVLRDNSRVISPESYESFASALAENKAIQKLILPVYRGKSKRAKSAIKRILRTCLRNLETKAALVEMANKMRDAAAAAQKNSQAMQTELFEEESKDELHYESKHASQELVAGRPMAGKMMLSAVGRRRGERRMSWETLAEANIGVKRNQNPTPDDEVLWQPSDTIEDEFQTTSDNDESDNDDESDNGSIVDNNTTVDEGKSESNSTARVLKDVPDKITSNSIAPAMSSVEQLANPKSEHSNTFSPTQLAGKESPKKRPIVRPPSLSVQNESRPLVNFDALQSAIWTPRGTHLLIKDANRNEAIVSPVHTVSQSFANKTMQSTLRVVGETTPTKMQPTRALRIDSSVQSTSPNMVWTPRGTHMLLKDVESDKRVVVSPTRHRLASTTAFGPKLKPNDDSSSTSPFEVTYLPAEISLHRQPETSARLEVHQNTPCVFGASNSLSSTSSPKGITASPPILNTASQSLKGSPTSYVLSPTATSMLNQTAFMQAASGERRSSPSHQRSVLVPLLSPTTMREVQLAQVESGQVWTPRGTHLLLTDGIPYDSNANTDTNDYLDEENDTNEREDMQTATATVALGIDESGDVSQYSDDSGTDGFGELELEQHKECPRTGHETRYNVRAPDHEEVPSETSQSGIQHTKNTPLVDLKPPSGYNNETNSVLIPSGSQIVSNNPSLNEPPPIPTSARPAFDISSITRPHIERSASLRDTRPNIHISRTFSQSDVIQQSSSFDSTTSSKTTKFSPRILTGISKAFSKLRRSPRKKQGSSRESSPRSSPGTSPSIGNPVDSVQVLMKPLPTPKPLPVPPVVNRDVHTLDKDTSMSKTARSTTDNQRFGEKSVLCEIEDPQKVEPSKDIQTAVVMDGSVTSEIVVDGLVTSEIVVDGSVTSEIVVDDQGTSEIVVDDQVAYEVVVDDQVASEVAVNDQGISEVVVDDQGISEVVVDDQVTSEIVVDGSVTSEVVVDGSVTSEVVVDGSVTSEIVADDQVISEVVVDDQVTSEIVVDGSVTSEIVVDDQVTSEVVVDDQVISEVVVDDQVTSEIVVDGSVTSEIASNESPLESTKDEVVLQAKMGHDNMDGVNKGIEFATSQNPQPESTINKETSHEGQFNVEVDKKIAAMEELKETMKFKTIESVQATATTSILVEPVSKKLSLISENLEGNKPTQNLPESLSTPPIEASVSSSTNTRNEYPEKVEGKTSQTLKRFSHLKQISSTSPCRKASCDVSRQREPSTVQQVISPDTIMHDNVLLSMPGMVSTAVKPNGIMSHTKQTTNRFEVPKVQRAEIQRVHDHHESSLSPTLSSRSALAIKLAAAEAFGDHASDAPCTKLKSPTLPTHHLPGIHPAPDSIPELHARLENAEEQLSYILDRVLQLEESKQSENSHPATSPLIENSGVGRDFEQKMNQAFRELRRVSDRGDQELNEMEHSVSGRLDRLADRANELESSSHTTLNFVRNVSDQLGRVETELKNLPNTDDLILELEQHVHDAISHYQENEEKKRSTETNEKEKLQIEWNEMEQALFREVQVVVEDLVQDESKKVHSNLRSELLSENQEAICCYKATATMDNLHFSNKMRNVEDRVAKLAQALVEEQRRNRKTIELLEFMALE